MTDRASPSGSAADNSVVNPLRIPGSTRARRFWNGLPAVGRLFVLLAIVDFAIRWLGLFGMRLFLDPAYPLGIFTTFLPHDGLILLPALVLARAPNLRAQAWVLWLGVVAVGLAEFLRGPLAGLGSGADIDPFAFPSTVAIATNLAAAAGWILIARAMRPRGRGTTELWLAGLSNLVMLVIVASSLLLNLGAFFAIEEPGPGVSQLPILRLNATAMILASIGTAYLVRSVLRGSRDQLRPSNARALATASALLLAGNALFVVVAGVFYFGTVQIAVSDRVDSETAQVILWLTDPFAWTLLVVAFGLGLADASGRMSQSKVDLDMVNSETPSPPARPARGGEVPEFQQPGHWTTEAVARQRARRERSKESEA